MIDLKTITIESARKSLDNKEYSVRDLVDVYLDNIKEKNEDINAYLEVFSDIDEQIEVAQQVIDKGESQMITGIPIGIKDNILIESRISSASSKMLENYKATYDATVIEKIKIQNPIFVGRCNMDEFAMGGSTESSAYGITKNPVDTYRVPGGSSGGSAAAVASDMSLFTLGSDTGGSIRQPASFCGVVGLKPTYGSVSRNGLMAMSSSLDVIGPITKSVEDAKIVFDLIKGQDFLDGTSNEKEAVEKKNNYKIGVPRNFLKDGIDPDVLEAFEKDLETMRKQGCEVVDIDIPLLKYSLAVYYIIMPSEVSSNMSRYDGVRFGERVEGKNLYEDYSKTRGEKFGMEVKRRIMIGTYSLSSGYYDAYYNKAWKVRDMIKEELEKAFEDIDLIALPTSPTPAFKIGENEDPLKMYLSDIFTVSANLTGNPAISLPTQQVERENIKLPVGLQLIAPHFHEEWLFDIGLKFDIIK